MALLVHLRSAWENWVYLFFYKLFYKERQTQHDSADSMRLNYCEGVITVLQPRLGISYLVNKSHFQPDAMACIVKAKSTFLLLFSEQDEWTASVYSCS